VGARAWTCANKDIEPEILKRRVENFFDVGLEAVNFVDEENLARPHVAQDAREVEFLLKDRAGRLIDRHGQFVGDYAGQRGFTKAGRAAEQHVVHSFTTAFGGFDGNRELFSNTGLAGEIVKRGGTQSRFKLPFFLKRRR
jgi:hypothetical protein